MRVIGRIVLPIALAALLLQACTLEHVSNGALDGFWHMDAIDTLATGGTLDLSSSTLFWGFQADLMHTQGAAESFYFRFSHDGATLTLYSPYLDHGHQDRDGGGDIPVADPAVLEVYGIHSLNETFSVDELSRTRLTLSTPDYRLSFTKF